MKIEYSILRYRPDLFIGESINVGVCFHNLENDSRDLKLIKSYHRLFSFDDELDKEFTIASLQSFKEDWESGSLFSGNATLKDFTKFFVTEFYFSKPKTVDVKQYKKYVEDTAKYYLNFSYGKSERLTKKQKMNYVNTYLKSSGLDFKRRTSLNGNFSDKLSFDFIVSKPNDEIVPIKIISNSHQSVNYLRSTILFAEWNNLNVVVMLEQEDELEIIHPLKTLLAEANKRQIIKYVTANQIDLVI